MSQNKGAYMFKVETMTLDQKWQLINRFILTKRKQKPNCLVLKQSSPSMGVWIDDSFFSIHLLVETLNKMQNKAKVL